jgi:hypothetical protein
LTIFNSSEKYGYRLRGVDCIAEEGLTLREYIEKYGNCEIDEEEFDRMIAFAEQMDNDNDWILYEMSECYGGNIVFYGFIAFKDWQG